MSTKTNFKRIALVAIAALGMGVLSSVPSQALVVGDITVTSTAGTATKAKSDSTTAATLTVSYTATAADTVTISFASLTKPTDATTTPVIDIFGNSLGETAAISGSSGVDTSLSTGATRVPVTVSIDSLNTAELNALAADVIVAVSFTVEFQLAPTA